MRCARSYLIARLLQCQFLLPNPLVACGRDLLGRLEGRLDTKWRHALQYLLRDQLVGVPAPEAGAADASATVRVTALIAVAAMTGIGHIQLAPTMTAAQQSCQQCLAALGGASYHGAFHVRVLRDQRPVGLILIPANVAFVMIEQ